MLLGGIRFLIPVIEAAHQQGYYVITADYLPDNIAHKYSDEYINVSIIDKETVLKAAQDRNIDGIMSFGVDPGVVTAAYVQMKMGLPAFGPYESVEILQNKDKFRAFLSRHGFNVPKAKGYSRIEEVVLDKYKWSYPVIVKPTDSAGSKGVSKVESFALLKEAAERAFSHSISKRIIIEEYIEKIGNSSDSDCFLDNGVLTFVSFSSQYFDVSAENPFVPAAYSWPSSFSVVQEDYLRGELQRLLSLLRMRTGVYNVETRIGIDGKPYLMEVSPRGGGNRLAEMARMGTGLDIITASIKDCVGDSFEHLSQCPFSGFWSEVIIHAKKSGVFEQLGIAPCQRDKVKEIDLWVSPGDFVHSFCGANDAIGTIVLHHEEQTEMVYDIEHINEWLHIITR